MSIITVLLLAVLCATYVVGFAYCLRFERRLRATLVAERVPESPAASSSVLGQVLGVVIVPLVIGGVFTFMWNAQSRWRVELNLVQAALQTKLEESRITWLSSMRVQEAYAKAYLPTR